MNREYNRTGSEKSSRILPGPMMLGWPSHSRAMVYMCSLPIRNFPSLQSNECMCCDDMLI